MTLMLEKINYLYAESIQNQISASKLLPDIITDAAQKMVDTLLNENKIIVCGQGRAYANAQFLVANLLHKYELARPSFPAVLLSLDGVIASALYANNQQDNLYLCQFEAIAEKGDLLFVYAPCGNENNLFNLMHCANNRELRVIVLTGNNNDYVKGFLTEQDLEIPVPMHKESRILEQHLFITNSLCELIDFSLFAHNS